MVESWVWTGPGVCNRPHRPALIPEAVLVKLPGLSGSCVSVILIHIAQRIPLRIYSFAGYMTCQWNDVCAFVVLGILRVLAVYCCVQKDIVDGMTAGAVKS